MDLQQLGRKAKAINIFGMALDNAKANSELISELNRQQLTVGENSKGEKIGEYSTQRYSDFKKRIGSQSPFGVPDLKVSGNLYKELKTTVTEKDITINSSVDYSKYQEIRYGKNIYDLQDQNWEEIEFKILTETIKDYVKEIQL